MDLNQFQDVISGIINKYASEYKYSDCGSRPTIDCVFYDSAEDPALKSLVVQMTDDTRYKILLKKD